VVLSYPLYKQQKAGLEETEYTARDFMLFDEKCITFRGIPVMTLYYFQKKKIAQTMIYHYR